MMIHIFQPHPIIIVIIIISSLTHLLIINARSQRKTPSQRNPSSQRNTRSQPSPSRREFHQGFNHLSPPRGGPGQGGQRGDGSAAVLDEGWVMGPLGLPVRRTLQVGNRGVQKAFNQGGGVGSPTGHSAPSSLTSALPFGQQPPPPGMMMMQAPYSAPQMQQPSMDYPSYPSYVDNPPGGSGGMYRPLQALGGGQGLAMGGGADGSYPLNNGHLSQHPTTAAMGNRRDPRTAIDGTDVMDERKQMQLLMKADQARALEEQIRTNALRAAAEKAKREAEEIEEIRRLEAERKAIADAFEKEKHEAKQRAEEANQAALSRQVEEKRRQKEDELRLEHERQEKENERIRKEQELLRQRELEEIQREAAGHRKPNHGSPPPSVTKNRSMQGKAADLFGPASPSPPAKAPAHPQHRPAPHHRDHLFGGDDDNKGFHPNPAMARPPQQRPESSTPTPSSLRQIKQEAHHAAEVAEEARRQVERLRQDLLDGVGSSSSNNHGVGGAGSRLLQRGAGRDQRFDPSSSMSMSRNFDHREMGGAMQRTLTSVDDSYDEVYRLDRTLNSDSCFVYPDGSSYRISGGGGDDMALSHLRLRRSTSAGGLHSGGRRRPRPGEAATAGATLPLGLGGPCLDLRGVGTPSADTDFSDRLGVGAMTSPHRDAPPPSFLDLRGLQHRAPAVMPESSQAVGTSGNQGNGSAPRTPVKSLRSPSKSSPNPKAESTTEATTGSGAVVAPKSSRPSSHRARSAGSDRDKGVVGGTDNNDDAGLGDVVGTNAAAKASGRGGGDGVDPIVATAATLPATTTSSSRPGSSSIANRQTGIIGTSPAEVPSSSAAVMSNRSSPRVPTPTADQVKEELSVLLRNLKLMAAGNGYTNNNRNNVPGFGGSTTTAMGYSRPSTPGSTTG